MKHGKKRGSWQICFHVLCPYNAAAAAKLLQSCLTLWTVARRVPLSMGFSRQEYWNGLPCPPAGDLPDPGVKRESPESPALQADSYP